MNTKFDGVTIWTYDIVIEETKKPAKQAVCFSMSTAKAWRQQTIFNLTTHSDARPYSPLSLGVLLIALYLIFALIKSG